MEHRLIEEKITIAFGTPSHGWLPTLFKAGDFALDLHVSDVPVDHVEQSIIALTNVLRGIKAKSEWFLEPDIYIFDIAPLVDNFQLTISHKDDHSGKEKLMFKGVFSFGNLILPFYRAIKEFACQGYNEPHWPPQNEEALEMFTVLIKERQPHAA